MKILFIEDQEELNAIGSMQLETLGHEVFSVYSVWEARKIYDRHKGELDVIIADHRLPDGLGIAFLEVLREAGCQIPSAVVSGCLTLSEQAGLQKVGIPFYPKPVLYSDVIRDVQRRLATAATTRANEDKEDAEAVVSYSGRFESNRGRDLVGAGGVKSPETKGFMSRFFRRR